MNPKRKEIWSGIHRGIPYEIAHWGLGTMNNGKGAWNAYIILHEMRVENFEVLWKPNTRQKWTPTSRERLAVDYMDGPLHSAPWHCGITYWSSDNDAFPGHRHMKIGCDYNHLWDEEAGHFEDLDQVLRELLAVIDYLIDKKIVITKTL